MKKNILNKDILVDLRHQDGIPQDILAARHSLESIAQTAARASDEIELLQKAIKDASKIFIDILNYKIGAEDKCKKWLKDYKV